jgi:KTSC domain-containing protein
MWRNSNQSQFVSLDSTNIKQVMYNEDARTLVVHYHSGHKYLYHGVTPHEYTGLVNAGSAGKYFAQHLSDKRFTRV